MSKKPFIHLNIHHFKTHISKYIRELERDNAGGIIVRRHGRPIAVFALLDSHKSSTDD